MTSLGETRNLAWEAQFYRDLSQRLEQRGVDCGALVDDVREGLAVGARVYGDDAFFAPDRDNYHEALMEIRDLVAYLMGQMQRSHRDERDGLDSDVARELRADMLSAAVLAARARDLIERAHRRHAEAWVPR